jgi:hypothetical protein
LAACGCSSGFTPLVGDGSADGSVASPAAGDSEAPLSGDAQDAGGQEDSGDATTTAADAGPSAGGDAAGDVRDDTASESGDATATGADAGPSAGGDAAGDVGNDTASESGDAGGDGAEDGAADAPVTCSLATGTWLDPRPWDSCDSTFCQCYGYAPDGGSLQQEYGRNENMGIRSLTLPVPMTPGQPYSLSVSVADNGFYGDIEIWGTDAVCGPGLERLYIQPVQSKVYCADLVASQPYPYLLFVERLFVDSGAPASEHADTIVACPTVRCGP